MKIDVTQEKLARALNAASRVASAKSGLPILGNILLRTDGKQLYVAATNLEVAITERLGAKIESTGSITAPAKLISDFVSNLPKDNVHIEVVNSKINITSDHYSSTINGVSDEEFPELPRVESKNAVQFSLTVDDFKDAASQTIIAASSDSTRPVLTGVYMHTHENNLYFAATDGYRLAEKKIIGVSSEVAAIVPVSTIQEVLRMVNEDVDQVEILLDDTQITFTLGTAEVTSRLIDGNFPDYRQLIPKKNMTECKISIDELKRIVKLAALFARETNGGIKLSVDTDKGSLSIDSIASELGENNSKLNVEATGDTATITLNSRYLNDALAVIASDQVALGFSGKLAPCVISPASKNSDYKHIIMPIKS